MLRLFLLALQAYTDASKARLTADTTPSTEPQGFRLKEWNVWHTYSTHVLFDLQSPKAAAEELVESGLAECAMVSSGEMVWRHDGKVMSGRVTSRPDSGRSVVTFPADMPKFVRECALQAATMATHEARLFHSSRGDQYVRAFGGVIRARFDWGLVYLYPQVKLYRDGAVLTEFRVLSGDREQPIDDFVDRQVNLYSHTATEVDLPPALWRFYLLGRIRRGEERGVLLRWRTLRLVDRWIQREMRREAVGDFVFETVRIDSELLGQPRTQDDPVLDLRLFAQMYDYAVGEVVFKHPRSVGRRAARRYPRGDGNGWIGRPAVYLLDYHERLPSASATIAQHEAALAKVMSRTSRDPRDARRFLSANLREFDDYAVFLNEALSLWVVGDLEGVNSAYEPKMPDSHFVLEKQVHVEYIEHLDRAYRRAREKAGAKQATVTALLAHRHSLATLDAEVKRASSFGEILALFTAAQKAYKHDEIRQEVHDNIQLRAAELADRSGRRSVQIGYAVSILLGVGVLPSIAADVVGPLIRVRGWWLPADPDQLLLYTSGLTAMVLLAAAGLAAVVLRFLRPAA